MGNFWQDLGRGFKKGWNSTKHVLDKIPVVNTASHLIPTIHKGGKVRKTGNYRLRAGELVLNKTQQAQIRKAKTPATIKRVVRKVAKQKPKPRKRAVRRRRGRA